MPIDFKNPYVIGGAGLLLVLLVFAGRGGGSAASNPMGASIASQGIASQTNASLAALQTGLDTTKVQANAAVAISGQQQDTAMLGLAYGYLTNLTNNMTAMRVQSDAIDASVKQTQIAADTYKTVAPQLAQINANLQSNIVNREAQLQTDLAIAHTNDLAYQSQEAWAQASASRGSSGGFNFGNIMQGLGGLFSIGNTPINPGSIFAGL